MDKLISEHKKNLEKSAGGEPGAPEEAGKSGPPRAPEGSVIPEAPVEPVNAGRSGVQGPSNQLEPSKVPRPLEKSGPIGVPGASVISEVKAFG